MSAKISTEQLRTQAEAMIRAARKMIEAADILEGAGEIALPSVASEVENRNRGKPEREAVTHDGKRPSLRALCRDALSASVLPLTRNEICEAIIQKGVRIEVAQVSTILSRNKDEFSNTDGKWTLAKAG